MKSDTREYLANAERRAWCWMCPATCQVLCGVRPPYHPQIVYLSQLNTSTLKNRVESDRLVL